MKELFAATLARFGRLDYLVNNGGGQFPVQIKMVFENGREKIQTRDTTADGKPDVVVYLDALRGKL